MGSLSGEDGIAFLLGLIIHYRVISMRTTELINASIAQTRDQHYFDREFDAITEQYAKGV